MGWAAVAALQEAGLEVLSLFRSSIQSNDVAFIQLNQAFHKFSFYMSLRAHLHCMVQVTQFRLRRKKSTRIPILSDRFRPHLCVETNLI